MAYAIEKKSVRQAVRVLWAAIVLVTFAALPILVYELRHNEHRDIYTVAWLVGSIFVVLVGLPPPLGGGRRGRAGGDRPRAGARPPTTTPPSLPSPSRARS